MLWLTIDRNAKIPLIRQIYLELRQQILQGKLPAQTQLPATRALAEQLQVSRNVVLEAYEQLKAEGFLVSRAGSGNYVAAGAAWLEPSIQPIEIVKQPNLARPPAIDFRSGVPALDQFPRRLWSQFTRRVCAEAEANCFGYAAPEGQVELRIALTEYLRRIRGLRLQPEQIVITAGAAQAFGLVVKLLAQPSDRVALEDPGPLEVRQIFAAQGVQLQFIPVDHQGIQPEYLAAIPVPKFVLVTPSHQFPTGSILTIQRRIQLLEFAKATGCIIIEDDYDSEFRFEGTPITAMQGLAPEQVIYVGTFSKILSPALRLGYLVLPPAYIQPCRDLKWLSDLHNSVLEQLTLAQFLQSGQLERHVIRMRRLYRQRRNALRQSLVAAFGEQVTISGDSTGLHLIAQFIGAQFEPNARIKLYPVANYATRPNDYPGQFVMGYGNLSVAEIQMGMERLLAGTVSHSSAGESGSSIPLL